VPAARILAVVAWLLGVVQLMFPLPGTASGLGAAVCGNVGLVVLGSAPIGVARWIALALGELGLAAAAASIGLGTPGWLAYCSLPLWLAIAGTAVLRRPATRAAGESRRPRRVIAAAAVGPKG
jgi:hypothetical protein